MLRSTVFATFLAAATAVSDIPATSALGNRLLSKASRVLNNNNNNDDVDFTWVAGYSLQFHSCHTTLEFRAEGGSGDEGYDVAPTESLRLVHFKLCPTPSNGKCGNSCSHGADYLVEMREFVESYLEFKEYECEVAAENCENGNDDGNLQLCYEEAGLDYCLQNQDNNDDDDEDFEIDRYLECENVNENNNNGDDYYGNSDPLYVGAYCSNNGKNIYLGTFSDRQCTKHTSVSAYKSLMGKDLPYTSKSIVNHDCMSCLEPSDNDDDGNNNGDEVREICEDLYERSAKCERHLSKNVVDNPSTGGCEYLFKTLPREELIARGRRPASFAFAWIFFLTTIGLSVYAFSLYKQTRGGAKIDLSAQGLGGDTV